MNRLTLPILGLVALLTLTGCEGMKYAPYGGQQQPWPTGNSLTDGVYDVPVYRGWPERPYEILGFIQFADANIDWNRGDAKQAAAEAKKAGCDAMIVLTKGADPSPTLANTRQKLGLDASRTTGVVIKWKQ